MSNEITRKVELWLRSKLMAAIPEEKFYAANGGDDEEDSEEIRPPFTVIDGADAEQTMPNEPTFLVQVNISRYSHFADTKSSSQSASTRKIYDAVAALPRGFDPDQGVYIHGTDITNVTKGSVENRADVITLTVGASG